MSRCGNEALLKKISNAKLTQEQEVEFTLLTNLPDCKKINVKDFIAIDGTYSYDPYKTPVNRFECMRTGCINSGTLLITGESTSVTYHIKKDATEFNSGVITFYVYAKDLTKLPVSVNVSIGNEQALTNADKYTATVKTNSVTDDGFVPVVIDLSAEGTTVGEGWTPTSAGAFIKLDSETALDGISSIALFDEMDDFATSDTVKIACLSEVGGTFDIGALEATCTASGYDTDSANGGFDFTVTGTLLTPNYWKLNPMARKIGEVDVFDTQTIEKTVESYNVDGKTYGKVTLADADQNECGFYAVQILKNCNITDSQLDQLTIPTLVDIDAGHFQIIKNSDGSTDVIFNETHIGNEVLVEYPVATKAEDRVYSMDSVGNTRVRMSYTKETSDNVKYRYVFNNVLITSFPHTISNSEEEISFTINVQRDSDGYYGHEYKYVA